MEKKAYMTPMVEMTVIEMQQLVAISRSTPPEEIRDYDDWFGARKRRGRNEWSDGWDD
jgi:hypothetical protein